TVSQGTVTCTVRSGGIAIGSVRGVVDSTGSASGTFTLGATVNAGSYRVSATFGGATLFGSSSGSGTLSVKPATPSINWSSPSAITYGTALDATQLNAAAVDSSNTSVPGLFSYNPSAGTILAAGTGERALR